MKCEKLDVWKKSARLSANVYKAFKECKDFGFKDQITRAELSIPSNIAEGISWIESSDHILSMLSNLQTNIKNRNT